MNHTVYIDIETIPSQEEWVREYAEETVSPPGNIKKQESIDNWYKEKYSEAVDEKVASMAFSGASNHIVSIGVAVDNHDPVSFDILDLSKETSNILDFYQYVDGMVGNSRATWVGHNINGFDLKVIRQRSIVLGIPLPAGVPFFSKPWDLNPFDTMIQWDPKNFTKLDLLARAFGIPGKDGMDGSKVYGAWLEGRIEEIGKYCREDVAMTREIYLHMVGQRKIEQAA